MIADGKISGRISDVNGFYVKPVVIIEERAGDSAAVVIDFTLRPWMVSPDHRHAWELGRRRRSMRRSVEK